jgi:hypothetical protein
VPRLDDARALLDAPGFVGSCGVEPGAAPGAAVLPLAAVFATVPVISTLWFTCWLRFTLESADSAYSSSAAVALDDRIALELDSGFDALLALDPIEASVSLYAPDADAPGEACCTQPVTVMGWPALLDRLCVADDDCA